jgi:hypothetical protein
VQNDDVVWYRFWYFRDDLHVLIWESHEVVRV